MEQFESAIFFDNDQGYLDDVKSKCPGVTRIKVNETRPLRKSSLNSGPLKDLMDSLHSESTENSYNKVQNSYVMFLRDYKNWVPSYYPESGIQSGDIQKYERWASTTKGKRILLLDWDLTLSMFDGLELPSDGGRENSLFNSLLIQPKDIAIFYLGGHERFRMITEWLKTVVKSGVYIAVLTNNTGAKDTLFKQIIAEIIPKGSFEIIASTFSPYDGDKGKALANDPRFGRLCVQTGGKRKRQTRRGRKARKYKKTYKIE